VQAERVGQVGAAGRALDLDAGFSEREAALAIPARRHLVVEAERREDAPLVVTQHAAVLECARPA